MTGLTVALTAIVTCLPVAIPPGAAVGILASAALMVGGFRQDDERAYRRGPAPLATVPA